MGKIITVPLSQLKTNLFVRVRLDDDRILEFAEMLDQLPPIQITKDFEVIDGRHRIEAHDLAGKTEIRAEIIEVKDRIDHIVRAYTANVGGAKPPTKEDHELTIRMLLEQKVSRKKIREILPLPATLSMQFVDNVQSRINRQKLRDAMNAISEDGLTLDEAAEKFGVDVKKLKEAISGRKGKEEPNFIEDTKRQLSNNFRSFNQKNAALLKQLWKLLDDGDITPKQAREILDLIKKLQNQSARRFITSWEERFLAQYPPDKKK